MRELKISRSTADKLLKVHGLHEDEVRATIEGRGGLPFAWHCDSERGWRAILKVAIRGIECRVVLYPAAGEYSEVWNLGSAYPDESYE